MPGLAKIVGSGAGRRDVDVPSAQRRGVLRRPPDDGARTCSSAFRSRSIRRCTRRCRIC